MTETKLVEMVERVRQLAPEQRRQLQRRLRSSGLLEPDELLTDRDRLAIAPALGLAYLRTTKSAGQEPVDSALAKATRGPASAVLAEPYRSPVSGKVVLGAPAGPMVEDPHAMQALPGQAPEQPIAIIFDGGSRGNPGQGYGSYALRWPGTPQQIVQLRFGDRVTNNEAEYDTLIAALEAVLKKLLDGGAKPSTARVEIRGDSLLVVNQVLKTWECKEQRLQVRRDRVLDLLQRFGSWQLAHHNREHSVRTLGH